LRATQLTEKVLIMGSEHYKQILSTQTNGKKKSWKNSRLRIT